MKIETTTAKLTSDGIIMLLKDLGIRYIQCFYSGGGDSGAIDEYSFYNAEQAPYLDWETAHFTDEDAIEMMNETPEIKEAWTKTEDLIYKILNTEVNDWWNNDGGFGNFLMDTETCEYAIANTVYSTIENAEFVVGKFESEI